MIKDRDTKFVTVDRSIDIHPIGTFAPYLRLSFTALRTNHGSLRCVEFRSETDSERSLFGITKLHRLLPCANGDFTIHDARALVSAECVLLDFLREWLLVWAFKVECSPQFAGIRPAMHLIYLAEDHPAIIGRHVVSVVFLKRLFRPEVIAIDITVSKVHPTLMRFQAGVMFMLRRNNVHDRKAACYHGSIGISHWLQIGFRDLRVEIVGCERL